MYPTLGVFFPPLSVALVNDRQTSPLLHHSLSVILQARLSCSILPTPAAHSCAEFFYCWCLVRGLLWLMHLWSLTMIYPDQCSTKADVCHSLLTWLEPTWLYCALQHRSFNSPESRLLRCGFYKVSVTSCLTSASWGNSAAVPSCQALCGAWGPLLSFHRAVGSDHPKMPCEDAARWLQKLCSQRSYIGAQDTAELLGRADLQ